MASHVVPVSNTLLDRSGVATVINSAYFNNNPYYRTIFPNSSQAELIWYTSLRWGHNLNAPGTWHLKFTDTSTGDLVSYSRWIVSDKLLKKLNEDYKIPKPTSEALKQYEKDFHLGSIDGEPKGLHKSWATKVEEQLEEARALFPKCDHLSKYSLYRC